MLIKLTNAMNKSDVHISANHVVTVQREPAGRFTTIEFCAISEGGALQVHVEEQVEVVVSRIGSVMNYYRS